MASKTRMIAGWAVAASLVAGCLTAATPAAAGVPDDTRTTAAASPREVRDFNALLAAVDQETGAFDAQVAADGGASDAAVDDFAATWLALDVGRVDGAEADDAAVEQLSRQLAPRASCRGRNTWDRTGLQYNVYLNSCKAADLGRAYATGAASLGVVTAIFGAAGFAPGAAGAGIVGAILGLGAAIVNNCNARNRGIIVRMIPPAIWCNGQ